MLLQEAEFRALQQQINPHFIFNILQTMQMIAEMNDQTELADMIAHFGRMVRYNLYATMNVPLEEELDNVRDYMTLQKVMYNDELEMDIDITDVPATIEVPRLLLQPLVENAVLHGRIKGQMLHVDIRGEHTGEGIRMRIRNNGKPLTPEREAELRRVLGEVRRNPGSVDGGNAKDNLALINIQKRLLICFGPQCHLHIGNDTDGTVLVEFIIPDKEVAS
jgi:two-component system sensor histidine kinase YesM